MIHAGRRGEYAWLASHSDRNHLHAVLTSCPEVVRGRFVAITSFDSGPLTPSPEELEAGWSSDGRIMYSPPIDDPFAIPNDQYDEWVIFAHETRQLPALEVFINYGGFTLTEERGWDPYRDHRERFWSQLSRISAESYLGEGDRFLFASRNLSVFECVEQAVRRLTAS